MDGSPLLRLVDAVTIPVADLDEGLRFYGDGLGHRLLWRDDASGQAALALPDTDAELVLSTRQGLEPDWLVELIRRLGREVGLLGGDVMEVAPPVERTPQSARRTLALAARYLRETVHAALAPR